MARVMRLQTKPERIKQKTAREIEAMLLEFSDTELPSVPRSQILNTLHKISYPANREEVWPGGFTMISREWTAIIWDAIRELPPKARPGQVRHAFDLILLNQNRNTNEVMLTRDEFAERMKCPANDVSRVMGTLERMGVIRREMRRVEGMRGRGMVVYVISEHIAWSGDLHTRKELAKDVPKPTPFKDGHHLRVVEPA